MEHKNIEKEIENSKIAIQKLEDGLWLNRVVLKAFEEELSKAK